MGSIPSNLVDVANQIRNGDIGIIDVVKFSPYEDIGEGDLIISALTGISGSDKKRVTRRPVQAGFQVVKGVVDVPSDKVLTIILADPDFSAEAGIQAALDGSIAGFTDTWRDKKQKLYDFFNGLAVMEINLPDDVLPSKFISEIEPLFDVDENWACLVARVVLTDFDNRQQGAVDDVETALTSGIQDVGGL